MDRWGPSENCPACGQAYSVIDFRSCPTCGAAICLHCMENHVCKKCEICGIETGDLTEIDDKLRCDDCVIEYMIQLTEPIIEAFGRIGYAFTGSIHRNRKYIYEFTSGDKPKIELRIVL